ncbi:MAG: family transcriptional regulator [Paenibacillus sp.]|jgi:predicted NBD/HSP70 family sugar kinase|nr:family transcriptional regulator [Paenibacillus sp.]
MKTYSGNHSFLKELNIITTLRLIQEKNLISRAALADALGLNRSTITAIINELLQQQLVKEVGIGASKGGRPPTLLQFNSDAAYTACIDWSYDCVKLFITNLGGGIYFNRQLDTKDYPNPNDQIRQVVEIIHDGYHQLPDKPLGLLGIGIVVPGIVEQGVVNSYSLGWSSVPLVSYFSEKFSCPIVVNNDANAGLIAEAYFGIAKGEHNVSYIRIGSSLSAALIINGQIVQGSEGFAGRIGHSTIDWNGRKCVCGNRGCWEAYCSERALLQRYIEISDRKRDAASISLDSIREAAHRSDPSAVRAIHELSEYLGLGAANMVNLLNPGLIVVGSSLGSIDTLIQPVFDSTLKQKVLPYLKRNIRIQFSPINERFITFGAAALVLDAIFTTPIIKSRDT